MLIALRMRVHYSRDMSGEGSYAEQYWHVRKKVFAFPVAHHASRPKLYVFTRLNAVCSITTLIHSIARLMCSPRFYRSQHELFCALAQLNF